MLRYFTLANKKKYCDEFVFWSSVKKKKKFDVCIIGKKTLLLIRMQIILWNLYFNSWTIFKIFDVIADISRTLIENKLNSKILKSQFLLLFFYFN